MKLLIAYDGSKSSDSALDDLVLAGLPEKGEALVMSIAEVWLPPPNGGRSLADSPAGYRFDRETEERIREQWERGEHMVAEAEALSRHARERVVKMLPGWIVNSSATYGSPAWEVLAEADEFDPDLIVVGSQGRSAIGRFVLGSISQKILTEAKCSVRIGRGRIEVDSSPARIMIAFDGSNGSFAAVRSVASRKWPAGSEVSLIAVAEKLSPSAIGRFIPPVAAIVDDVNEAERIWLEEHSVEAVSMLEKADLKPEFRIVTGNPKQALIEEAENWRADCIFLGANEYGSRTERFLLGSTSAAVAARAHCSVEVVRESPEAAG